MRLPRGLVSQVPATGRGFLRRSQMRRLSSSGFEVRGVDASPESVRRSGVGAVLGYADEVDHLFPPRSFDAVNCSSVFHEVFSYGNGDGVIGDVRSIGNALDAFVRVMKPGAVLVVRDGVHPGNEVVTMKADADAVHRFLEHSPFVPGSLSSPPYPTSRTIALSQVGEDTFRGSASSVMEFMFTYTWGPSSFTREVQEFYGIFNREEYARFVCSHGFELVDSYEYVQDGYIQHLRGKVDIDFEFPSTNAVWSYVLS